jgi:hypothetical protein
LTGTPRHDKTWRTGIVNCRFAKRGASFMQTRLRMAWRLAFLLLTVLTLSSCASVKRGDVHGKVSRGGRPIIYGSVVLIGSNDIPVTGRINADGTYAVSGVPAGAVRVAVVSPDPATPLPDRQLPWERNPKAPLLPPKRRPMAPEVDRRKWFALPKQYEMADTSGITTTIHSGDNTFDIDLK